MGYDSTMEQYKVQIDEKCFDITLHQGGDPAIRRALRVLGNEGDRIDSKKLLEAYLSKAIEHEKVSAQLAQIEARLEKL